MFQALANNLENQVAVYSNLLDLVTQESMLDHQTNLDELNACDAAKLACLQEAHQLELERQGLTQSLTAEFSMEEDTKLELLATHAAEEMQERLLAAKNQLLALAPEIQKLSRTSAERMQLRANCYKEVNDGFHKKFKRTSFYSKFGKINAPKGSLLLNHSV